MAKLECELSGNFDELLQAVDSAAMSHSSSASKEDESDFTLPSCQCAVRVYERYSVMGSNRVSLNVTLLQSDGRIFLSAISSGGSQAMFFKVQTLGEESFLECFADAMQKYIV